GGHALAPRPGRGRLGRRPDRRLRAVPGGARLAPLRLGDHHRLFVPPPGQFDPPQDPPAAAIDHRLAVRPDRPDPDPGRDQPDPGLDRAGRATAGRDPGRRRRRRAVVRRAREHPPRPARGRQRLRRRAARPARAGGGRPARDVGAAAGADHLHRRDRALCLPDRLLLLHRLRRPLRPVPPRRPQPALPPRVRPLAARHQRHPRRLPARPVDPGRDHVGGVLRGALGARRRLRALGGDRDRILGADPADRAVDGGHDRGPGRLVPGRDAVRLVARHAGAGGRADLLRPPPDRGRLRDPAGDRPDRPPPPAAGGLRAGAGDLARGAVGADFGGAGGGGAEDRGRLFLRQADGPRRPPRRDRAHPGRFGTPGRRFSRPNQRHDRAPDRARRPGLGRPGPGPERRRRRPRPGDRSFGGNPGRRRRRARRRRRDRHRDDPRHGAAGGRAGAGPL
ncbi:MAG: hypothetical protein AVDCRST_MAG73-1216, partial [uncultured Thermomicrobiales bacterium]